MQTKPSAIKRVVDLQIYSEACEKCGQPVLRLPTLWSKIETVLLDADPSTRGDRTITIDGIACHLGPATAARVRECGFDLYAVHECPTSPAEPAGAGAVKGGRSGRKKK